MKRLPASLVLLMIATSARLTRADACHPPDPGSWKDERVVALFDSGQDRLAVARELEGDGRQAEAARAEAVFREAETRIACLPTTVVALAQALELQGKFVLAAEQYRRLLEAKPFLEKYAFYAAPLAEAERALPLALEHTARVALHLRGRDCALGTPHAYLDKESVPLDGDLRVDPGEHVARVEVLGCAPFSRSLTATAGSDAPVLIDLLPKTVDVGHGQKKWLGLPPWAVISAGAVLAVGVGVGSYFVFKPSEPAQSPQYSCSSRAALGCIAL